MLTGWIKVYRAIMGSCVRRGYGVDTLGVMVWLLLIAEYEPTEHPLFGTLNLGETVVKKPLLAREMGITESRLRAILSRLEKDGFITVKGQAKCGTKVGIVNYRQYQGLSDNSQKQPVTESSTCENNSPINNGKEKPKNRKTADKSPINQRKQPVTESSTCENNSPINTPINHRETAEKPSLLKEYNNIKNNNNVVPEVLQEQNTPEPASDFILTSEPQKPKKAKPEITFDYDNGCQFGGDGLEAAMKLWSETYPGLDIESQLKQARAWLFANSAPAKRKRNIKAFLCRWMAKAQEMQERRDAWKGAKPQTISEKQKEWASGKFSGDYSEVKDDEEFSKL